MLWRTEELLKSGVRSGREHFISEQGSRMVGGVSRWDLSFDMDNKKSF